MPYATTWKAKALQISLLNRPGSPEMAAFQHQLGLSEKVILPSRFFSTLHHRSFLLSDCSTFICTRVKQRFSNFIHLGLIFFFIVQCPGKADTKIVLALAITIRKEGKIKFL